MKKLIVLLLVCSLAACDSGKKQALKNIQVSEQKMRSDSTSVLNASLGRELISNYMAYAQQFPKDSLAPDFLFRAAEVHAGMAEPKEALKLYEKIYNEYPKYSKHSYCLFLQGFVYETQLQDNKNAKIKYEAFLKAYPEHPLAKDVQSSLNNLGKSNEELIREFEQKITDSSTQ